MIRKGQLGAIKDRASSAANQFYSLGFLIAVGLAAKPALIVLLRQNQAFPFDLFELRAVDETISDDMLLCIDALRWGQSDLHSLVPDGDRRVRAVIDQWGLKWPEAQ